jgi:DNA polymerase-3 subunit alpha
MNNVRNWLMDNQAETLKQYNYLLFEEIWDKYTKGKVNLSAWEMESLCFYYHDHELKDVDAEKYGIENFFDYSSEPIIETMWRKTVPIYHLFRIAGTVISKNDPRHSITLLTTDGVVPVKFTRDMYAMYKRQISEVQPDGSKKVVEKGWFTRGTMLLLNGFRRDDMFVVKKYASTQGHTVYKITDIKEDGSLILENERGKKDV